MAREDYRFTRREIREALGWSDFQVKTHLWKLTELEYVVVHQGGRGRTLVYELLWHGEGADGGRFLLKLLDVDTLQKHAYDRNLEGSRGHLEGRKRDLEGSRSPQSAPKEGSSRVGKSAGTPSEQDTSAAGPTKGPESTSGRKTSAALSYPETLAARSPR